MVNADNSSFKKIPLLHNMVSNIKILIRMQNLLDSLSPLCYNRTKILKPIWACKEWINFGIGSYIGSSMMDRNVTLNFICEYNML